MHCKKRRLQLHLKNAAIDPKNAAIGYEPHFYSRVFKCSLSYATIAPYGDLQPHFYKHSAGTPIAAFFNPLQAETYSCIFYKTQLQTRFGLRLKLGYRYSFGCVLNTRLKPPIAAFKKHSCGFFLKQKKNYGFFFSPKKFKIKHNPKKFKIKHKSIKFKIKHNILTIQTHLENSKSSTAY